ncbi:MAG: sigma-70 family RNA polymerase sigma factor [Planctomycetota bacterium]
MSDPDVLDLLASRSARGDAQAFTALVETLAPGIRAFIAVRASSATMVDEVVQAAFVTAYLQMSTYEPRGNLEGWIKGIARNHLREELRRQQRSIPNDDLAERLVVDDCLATFEDVEQQQHAAERLHGCLERLPDSTRRLIKCRYWDDEPLEQLAKRVRQPANRLAALLYRARQSLMSCLESGT